MAAESSEDWIGGRAFTFDYAGQAVVAAIPGRPFDRAARRPNPVAGDEDGEAGAFARIEVEVDGAKLDMVFDTAATITLLRAVSGSAEYWTMNL